MPVPSVEALIRRGVSIPAPDGVFVSDDVNPDAVHASVVLYPGARLSGDRLSIGPGCKIGEETPATVVNCQLEREVRLKGGFFEDAVFLRGASMGSGAHVRPGCLFEEEANGAHTCGFKQTIFLPFVTAGSLINFCDALMAGGKSRKCHSEIGSSYIHFNYTPHGDKATPSLMGDVPRGVMLDQSPIFLGGQGGLVGPARIDYGCVIPAGTVWRGDVTEPDRVCFPHEKPVPKGPQPYTQGAYKKIGRLALNNLAYIGNVIALRQWYRQIRQTVMTGPFRRAAWEGAVRQLDTVLDERIKRLGQMAGKMERSIAIAESEHPEAGYIAEQKAFADGWETIESELRKCRELDEPAPDALLAEWSGLDASLQYTDAIQSLSDQTRAVATAWLQGMVDRVTVCGCR